MTWPRILCLLVLIALAATAVVQRKTMATVRSDNAALQQQNEQAKQLARENAEIARLRAANQEVTALVQANKDLPKLRNEIRQLRQQKPEIEKLRADNARLLAAVKSSTNPARPRLAEMEGYVGKETWAHAGFATPGATLQTFFWAAANNNLQQLAECMTPKTRASFLKEFEGKSEGERQQAFAQGVGQLGKMGGYRVADQQQVSENKVILEVQAAAGGHIIKMPLERFGNEWKLDEPK